MAENNNLEITVKAVDGASGVISGVQQRMSAFDMEVAKLNQSMAAIDAQTSKTNAELSSLTVTTEAAALTTNQLGEATVITGTKAKAAGDSFGEFGQKIEKTLGGMAYKLTVLAALMAAFQFLTSAVEESTKANKAYTDKFKDADEAMLKMKTGVGNAFLPAMELVKQTFVDLFVKTDSAKQGVSFFGEVVFAFAQGFSLAMASVKLIFGAVVDGIGTGILAIIDGFQNAAKVWAAVVKGFKEAMKGEWTEAWNSFSEISNLGWKNFEAGNKKAQENWDGTIKQMENIANQRPPTLSTKQPGKPGDSSLKNAIEEAKRDFANLKDSVTLDLAKLALENKNQTEQMNKDLAKLDTSYKETQAEGVKSLETLAESHRSSTASIQNSIDTLNQSLDKLEEKYKQQKNTNISGLAKAFVDARNDASKLQTQLDSWQTPKTIADTQIAIQELQSQMAKAGTPDDLSILEIQMANAKAQLAAEQVNDATAKKAIQDKLSATKDTLAQSSALQAQYADQIAAADRFNSQSALQQAIDLFNIKQAQDRKQYEDEMANYNRQMSQINAKAALENLKYAESVQAATAATSQKLAKIDEEVAAVKEQQEKEDKLYKDKVAAITKLMKEAEEERQKASQASFNKIKANVEAEIRLYQELANAMSKVMSAGSQSVINAIPQTRLAEGGIVNSPTVALIGEAGPEAVIPLSKAGSMGGGTTINIINPTVRNDNDIAMMRDQIEKVMRPLFLNAKPNYV